MTSANWWALVAVAGGGALGAVVRYLVSLLTLRWGGLSVSHLATLGVNVVGCLAIGGIVGCLAGGVRLSETQVHFLRTGFLGGLTTFSSFGLEVYLLGEQQRWGAAIMHLLLNLVFGVACVYLGVMLGRAMTS